MIDNTFDNNHKNFEDFLAGWEIITSKGLYSTLLFKVRHNIFDATEPSLERCSYY